VPPYPSCGRRGQWGPPVAVGGCHGGGVPRCSCPGGPPPRAALASSATGVCGTPPSRPNAQTEQAPPRSPPRPRRAAEGGCPPTGTGSGGARRRGGGGARVDRRRGDRPPFWGCAGRRDGRRPGGVPRGRTPLRVAGRLPEEGGHGVPHSSSASCARRPRRPRARRLKSLHGGGTGTQGCATAVARQTMGGAAPTLAARRLSRPRPPTGWDKKALGPPLCCHGHSGCVRVVVAVRGGPGGTPPGAPARLFERLNLTR